MIKVICLHCKKVFWHNRILRKRKYCSLDCSNRSPRNIGQIPWNKNVSGYSTSMRGKKYPERSGTNNPRWKRVKRICKICKKVMYVKKAEVEKGWGNYCSRKCFHKSTIGRKMSVEWINKIRKSNLEKHRAKKRIKGGYVYFYMPSYQNCDSVGYVAEHRLVVEKIIGRYLKPTEPCHHLGAKDDNRPHMLMAFAYESAHQRFHKDPTTVKPHEIIFDGRLLV